MKREKKNVWTGVEIKNKNKTKNTEKLSKKMRKNKLRHYVISGYLLNLSNYEIKQQTRKNYLK